MGRRKYLTGSDSRPLTVNRVAVKELFACCSHKYHVKQSLDVKRRSSQIAVWERDQLTVYNLRRPQVTTQQLLKEHFINKIRHVLSCLLR